MAGRENTLAGVTDMLWQMLKELHEANELKKQELDLRKQELEAGREVGKWLNGIERSLQVIARK